MPCVNAAGEIVSYTIPWLQDCIDREKGLTKAKAAQRRRYKAPRYELVHRVPKPDVLADEWRWSIKITRHNGSVEWVDDYYEKADAEKEIVRLRDRFDAHRHEEFTRGSKEYRGVGFNPYDGTWKAERAGQVDDPFDADWN